MKKGSGCGVAAWCLAAMVVVLVAEVHETVAVNCNVVELTPCLGAIRGSEDPSPDCCSKLKEQVPCFCGYINNPILRPYVDSPNAKKVAAICDVPTPKC
ncbi:hypothetical protein CDL12_00270 [Handroanthus impetiginosus]|uniref:Bifunctional inhibitor/plant lipid transfer protein/seed storage helical domain-containing protein n=1 Tax=Handroanthus impetiginosus TaxID=429701 RepID=A0A2G9HFZ0_9LAMI|nr:hypothetical protein CDL12_10881 [Handroanthus impetiginosus]PIN26969.1 hypothetical protein CDL12_00270 [Handroanthus impetiginosus]